MDSFKSRLIEEQTQLKERIEKLDSFIGSDKIHNVHPTQQMLLTVQTNAMKTYLACLNGRIYQLENY